SEVIARARVLRSISRMDPHEESQESPMDPSVGSQQTQLDNLEESEDYRFGDRDETSSDATSVTSCCPRPVSGRAADIVWSAFVTERKVAGGRRQCRCKTCGKEFPNMRNTLAQRHVLSGCKDNPFKSAVAEAVAKKVPTTELSGAAARGRSGDAASRRTAAAVHDGTQPQITSRFMSAA
ncbi:unnamed protein product, partial [Phaeothamnion confervicola]